MKTLTATKIGSGTFEINVFENNNLLGTFETNNASLYDDICEMNDETLQNENELMTCETFDELIEDCCNKLN